MQCPSCGKNMVKRTGKYGPFFGCTGYPNCRTTIDYKETELKSNGTEVVRTPLKLETTKTFIPSPYQQAIFDFVEHGQGNAVVEAVAGSGKTTTIVQALSKTSKTAKVAFVAFNVHIKEELSRRAPGHVKVMTVHSLGYAALRKAIPGIQEPDEDKLYNICKELLPDLDRAPLRGILARLVSLAKATLVDATKPELLENMAMRYGIDLNGDAELLFSLVPTALKLCLERVTVIDYDDMIWLPLMLGLPVEQFDWLFVDEYQDLNKSQTRLVLKALKANGRVVAVGDRSQSMYGFRGADTDAMQNLIEELHATVMPLSICYRCPKSHVALAKELVPQIEAAPNAPDGLVTEMHYYQALSVMKDGDLVLCRINAALVSCAYALIKRGVKATIRGRDIGKGLLDLIDKLNASGIADLIIKLDLYKAREMARLEAKGNRDSAKQAISDKCDTLNELTEGMADLTELRNRISTLFSDTTRTGVILSTVHRAKGDENNRVWLIKPELMPLKMSQEWEMIQETNIQYVAYTRSKSELIFVNGM